MKTTNLFIDLDLIMNRELMSKKTTRKKNSNWNLFSQTIPNARNSFNKRIEHLKEK